MEIKFQGTLSLVDGTVVKTFPLPADGVSFGITGITEKNLNTRIKVAGGASDVVFNFGGVDEAKILIIVSDQNISYKKNSTGGEVNNLVASKILSTDKNSGLHFLSTSGVTSLYFSNSGTESANVDIYIAS